MLKKKKFTYLGIKKVVYITSYSQKLMTTKTINKLFQQFSYYTYLPTSINLNLNIIGPKKHYLYTFANHID